MTLPRPGLCPRCGAILDTVGPEAGERREGQCPSCGLGYSTSAIVLHQTSEPLSDAAQAEQQRAQAEVQARKRSAASRCDFAVYGLDATWSGRRWFRGWGESDGESSSVEVAHGDAFDEAAPLLRVRTEPVALSQRSRREHFRPEQARLLKLRHAAQGLAQELWHAGADHSAALQATFAADDPTEQWSPLPLIVDGQTVTLRWLVGWTSWVALGVTNDSVVGVQARNIEPDSVRLVVIDDLEPYLADDGLPR
jgi:hypothetical protein